MVSQKQGSLIIDPSGRPIISKTRADELDAKARADAKVRGEAAAKVRIGNENAQISLPLRLLPSPKGENFLMAFSDKPQPEKSDWMPSEFGIWIMLYQLHILTGKNPFELRDIVEAKLSAILHGSTVENPQFRWHLFRSLERRQYLKSLLKKAEFDIEQHPGEKQFTIIKKRIKYLLSIVDVRFKDRDKNTEQDNTMTDDEAAAELEEPMKADPKQMAAPKTT